MPHCVAMGCTNTSGRKSKAQLETEKHYKTTFHRFPKKADIRKEWIDQMGLIEASLPKDPYLCSRHFSNESFDRTSAFKIRLKDSAIPSIHNVQDVFHTATNQATTVLQEMGNINVDNLVRKKPMKRECTTEDGAVPSDKVEEPTKKKQKIVTPQTDSCDKKDAFSQTPSQPMSADKATWVFKSFIADSPTKMRLRAIIKDQRESYEKDIKVVKQATQRKDKQIATLRNVLTDLKEHHNLTDEELDVSGNIGTSTEDLLKRVRCKSKHDVVPQKFSPELRSFALTLHYYSPRAYNYVREKFDSCLPHPKTLSNWYRSVNGAPGFSTEVLNAIKERARTVDHLLVGSLVFDEMAIRQHIEYDGKKFSGYEDMGGIIASDEQTVAKDALVFLFVCVNSSWKIPVGFFLTGGVHANQKVVLIQQCLTMLQESGVRVISVTFDGAPANISAAKQLGCNFGDPSALAPSFPHPITSEKVYVIPDPCHMIKLVRNTLGDPKLVIMNGDGDSILWKYITKIHKIQEKEGLHLANKLRSRHVEFKKQKMKVKLATQVPGSNNMEGQLPGDRLSFWIPNCGRGY